MKSKKQAKKMSPAEVVIFELGGLRPAARKLGCHHATLNKWKWSEKDGGCNGFIPRKAIHRILDLVKKHKWNITAYDLILGRNGKILMGKSFRKLPR